MKILITGGTGYIGSHVAVNLVNSGHDVVLFDNLINSHLDTFKNIKKILNRKIEFLEGDLNNPSNIKKVFDKFKIDAVFHLAGHKSVNESVLNPLEYYSNNFSGTINLLCEMKKKNIKLLVFSSSATVYGSPKYLPIDENHVTKPKNPYGRIKLQIEEMLEDIYVGDKNWRIASLRYFNPVGSHESGLIGDNPSGSINNLMPLISKVATKKSDKLIIFGNDYETHDGTGVRDYIHIMDLAEGHQQSLNYLLKNKGFFKFNLGTGKGYSVLDLVKSFSQINSCKIPYVFSDRRKGDVSECYANPKKAYEYFGWQAKRTLDDMCKSTWKFIKLNENKRV